MDGNRRNGRLVPPLGKKPEEKARGRIDAQLVAAGWAVQDRDQMNLYAARGVAVREFALASGSGFADYLLFVDQKAVGVLEAKPEGYTLSGVEVQTEQYSQGLPSNLDVVVRPLPFLYQANGEETRFTNALDPDPRARKVFQIHRPETLAEWLATDTLDAWVKSTGSFTGADDSRPSSLRSRLLTLPELERSFLFPNQFQGIINLEHSLKRNHPRSLIQMATGSGKTIMAITSTYRLIKYASARRVLFLVDRANLGEQAEKEFDGFRTPDDNRKFTELYNVQRLVSNTIGASAKVVITTIQRLYSMLKGEPDFDPMQEEESAFASSSGLMKEPLPVVYNPTYPPEYFDVIFIDECHRSIYSLWRQVLEYFDAFLIGLTATPAAHTFGFFNQNLVMEYPHEQAVADGVNVDFEVYKIRTKITEEGSTIEARDDKMVGYRERASRHLRWERPDEDITYGSDALDRGVVAKDQIRLIVRTFRDRLFTELFPGRKEVPKTLIFAKDDSHAEDTLEIVREEFGRGNAFCQKITYKTTGAKPSDLIQSFRNSYEPRIAVTVDMIATGTDIKPVEIVMFMRAVKSRVLFEQMKGRGVRIIDPTDLKAVTPDAVAKTHFAIIDCVGITDAEVEDTYPLERKKAVPLKALLEHVAMGGIDPDVLSSLASRLSRLDKRCDAEDRRKLKEAGDGQGLTDICGGIVKSLDVDTQFDRARQVFGVPETETPTEKQIQQAAETLKREAAKPLASKPALRNLILDLKHKYEQIIDEVSKDELVFAGTSEEAREKARAMVKSFEAFLAEHKEEIDALQFFFSQPYSRRLHYADIKTLAEVIKAPPHSWTPDILWRAYELLERDRVRGASGRRLLTDIVSLVRFALRQEPVLTPYAERVRERFANWLAQQETRGRRFTEPQTKWLAMIRDHIATSLEMELDDFDLTPFAEEGGLGRASQVFGKELPGLLKELNEALVA
ncbi:MAG: restriction endonuclease subunit R [Myxococcales bacterium]|nr:MAG: restriction endonuclease subunit R [Myxococcales bacterium]